MGLRLVFGDEQSDVILDEAFDWICALQCAVTEFLDRKVGRD